MYNDSLEYLNFLKEHNVVITSENLSSINQTFEKVINPKLNWNDIISQYNEKKIVVVDDFLNYDATIRLRNFVLFYSKKEDFYKDYAAINFYKENENGAWFPLMSNIIKDITDNFVINKNIEFLRSWAFIYENLSGGVGVHADPASINFNLWVTPNDCLILEDGYNGLDLWKVYPPEDWSWQDYNRNVSKIENFLNTCDDKRIRIEYKFNRVVIFDSKFFHKTQPIEAKPGYKNRRINYTFLFN